MKMPYDKKVPHRHAYGPLQTKGDEFHKPCSKSVRDRVRRWAKRVMRRLEDAFHDDSRAQRER